MFSGSKDTYLSSWWHSRVISQIFNNPKSFTKSAFFEGILIFSWKSSFSCRVGNFFTSQYGTYECVLWVLNTLGHYLNFLGPYFWYRFLFWKNSIFSTSIASKSSRSLQNPYRLSSKVGCRSTFFRFSQSLSNRSQMLYNQIGMVPGVSRNVISVTSFPITPIGFLNCQ